jgi:acetylornithine/N-succinyldiaminopimelate aminotransferase
MAAATIDPVMPTYARFDLTFVKGEGAYLFDSNGNKYLDFGSGVAVTSLGHCHPHLVETLQKQAATLWHCSNLYHIPDQERLAARLVENTFADSVFFANSGAEAVECCLKMARRYHDENGNPEKYRIVTCEGAFHGRTLATLAATGQEKVLQGFDPIVDGFDQVAFGNLNELRNAITEKTAAILVEPVQGEGGIRPAETEYLQNLRKAADEFEVLLIFDEVQTGMGRTGKLFAHEWAGVTPDVMSIAKGFGGGFPIGACLATEKAAKALGPGSHGSTFGGNPLASSVANAVLDVMLEPGFFEHVETVAAAFRQKLEGLAQNHTDLIDDVRGLGLMLGLKCKIENTALVGKLQENGLLAIGAGDNVVRFVPPLIIEDTHVDEAIAIIAKSLDALSKDAA